MTEGRARLNEALGHGATSLTLLAIACHVTKSAISAVATGKNKPSLDLAIALRDTLGIGVDDWQIPPRFGAISKIAS
jgi:plasmid maintenance system antidote protein VapI